MKRLRLIASGPYKSAGGGGSKSSKSPGCTSRRAKRIRNALKREARKDSHVFKSSHGHFRTVKELETHRHKVMAARKNKPAAETTVLDAPES